MDLPTRSQIEDESSAQLIMATVLGGSPDTAAKDLLRATLPAFFAALPDVAGATIRRLRVQKAALDMLLGYYQRQVDIVTPDVQKKMQQQIATLQLLRTNTAADLALEQRQSNGSSGSSAAVGTIADPGGQSPTVGGYASGHPRFRGSPYYPRLPRRP